MRSSNIFTSPIGQIERNLFPLGNEFSYVRRSLKSINAARSLRYGSNFRKCKWYTNDVHLSGKVKTISDRRNSFFALKITWILDSTRLREFLESLTTREQQTKKDKINIISDGSFSDLMQRANEQIWRKF